MTAPEPTAVLAPAGPAVASVVAGRVSKAEADQEVVDTVAGVNAMLRRFLAIPADGQPWAQDHVLGANLLATRFYRRRASPAGVEVFGGEGAVAYIARVDPEAAQLLGLGVYTPPAVG